jgi:hypothetical protein
MALTRSDLAWQITPAQHSAVRSWCNGLPRSERRYSGGVKILRILRVLFSNRLSVLERLGKEIRRIGRADFGRVKVVLINAPELLPELLIEKADDFVKGPVLRIVARPFLAMDC